jgi:MtaA/CmuA family methyltransferase
MDPQRGDAMNGRERFFAFIEGRPVDRIPDFSTIKAVAAKYAGIPYGLYCMDCRYLVKAYMSCCEIFGIDITGVMSDPYREAYDFGMELEFRDDDMPRSKQVLIKDKKDIYKLKPYDPYKARRALNTCNAIKLFKETAGDRLVIYGIVEMPFSESVTLRGMQDAMADIYDDPELLYDMMDIILPVMKLYAIAQIKAGADVVGFGDAPASLVSPKIYREMILPYETELIKTVHDNGALARLHICGNINHILPYMAQTGADIIDLDWMVDPAKAADILGDEIFISGNLDPVAVYLEGTPETVRSKVRELASLKLKTLIISSGCEIPRDAPVENIMAHRLALEEIGSV